MEVGFATSTIRAVPQKLRSFERSFAHQVPQMLFDQFSKNGTGKRTDCQELASQWDFK